MSHVGRSAGPGKSLPKGTFAAVGLSTVGLRLGGDSDGRQRRSTVLVDDRVMRTASLGPLIDAGVIAATLSSAMASFLGAPRILQSLAVDQVFPLLAPSPRATAPPRTPPGRRSLPRHRPRSPSVSASLNVIAPVVSMFFLISYGLLNYATYYEARALSPSFRPRFRFFNRRPSLVGGLACLGSMLAINPMAGGAAVLVLYLIYRYLGTRDRTERWADGPCPLLPAGQGEHPVDDR